VADDKKAISLSESQIFTKEENFLSGDSEISDLIKISELIDDELFNEMPLAPSTTSNDTSKLPVQIQRTIEGVIDDVIYQATKNFKRRLREDLTHALSSELAKYFKDK
jgi:hypothetical protein